MKVNITVNDRAVTADVPGHELLSDFLRDRLGLTGTHVGCDTSQCGACVVHVNGASVKSCATLACALDGATVRTIEGLSAPGSLHPMQKAFHENHGLQCGFCTPGMIMSAVDFATVTPAPTAEAARRWLEGNLCRCTGYQNIVAAVLAGSAAMQTTEGARST
ncbi:MAG: 2Fe-2S iron-sulfur cluster binding domain-containing protein [Betaproteobacteria bacterium]|nr:2Fe-2S iron-sulfur cluster binding domain-containing protein [Betaproteobacteria bacterium]